MIGGASAMVHATTMQFAIISDTHLTRAAPAFDANLAAARSCIAARDIAHTVHLGDITADGAVTHEQLLHAADRLANWPGTIRFLPGNHDIGDNPGEHGHPGVDAARMARYADAFGAQNWVFCCNNWTLIGLNAQLFGGGDDNEAEQDAWLDGTLIGVSGPVGIFLHKPLFRHDPADPDPHHRYVPVAPRTRLLARLKPFDVRFVVAGHTHQTRKFHNDGIEHVWVPSTAFILPDAMQETIGEKKVGMMILTLTDGPRPAHRFDFVIPAGMIDYNLVDHADAYPGLADALRALPRDAS